MPITLLSNGGIHRTGQKKPMQTEPPAPVLIVPKPRGKNKKRRNISK
jgi:hypothetical protein